MRSILFMLCLLPLVAISQEKAVVKEKEVSVEVSQDDNSNRDVTITSSTNGNEKVIQWKDNGTIPEDIKAQLIEAGIDLNILDSTEEMIGEDVEIHIDRKEMTSPKNVVIKMIEDEGDSQVMEWNRDGKMPKEMRDLLEEHDIDIEKMDNDSQVKKTRIKVIKKESQEKHKKAKSEGRKMNKVQKQKFRTVTIDKDGNQEVKEWKIDGENMKLHSKGNNKKIWIADGNDQENILIMEGRRERSSDAYLGAHISSSKSEGALVEDLAENGPASKSNLKKGDIIQKVNGARVKSPDDLLDLLSYYEPSDHVDLTVSRDGKEEKVTLKLGKRPQVSRL